MCELAIGSCLIAIWDSLCLRRSDTVVEQCISSAELIENILLNTGARSCLKGLLLKCEWKNYLQLITLSNEVYVVELISGEIMSENQKSFWVTKFAHFPCDWNFSRTVISQSKIRFRCWTQAESGDNKYVAVFR